MNPSEYFEALKNQWPRLTEMQLAGLDPAERREERDLDEQDIDRCCETMLKIQPHTDNKYDLAAEYCRMKEDMYAASITNYTGCSKRASEVHQILFMKNCRVAMHLLASWFSAIPGGNPPPPEVSANANLLSEWRLREIDQFKPGFSVNLEINFHQQKQASVFFESHVEFLNVDVVEKKAEIAMLTAYALRVFANLGVNDVSDSMARRLVTPGIVELFARGTSSDGPQLIPYPGHPGRYKFTCKLLSPLLGSNIGFEYEPLGFSEGNSPIDYYSSSSVYALLRFLAEQRNGDLEYLECLATCAETCARSHLDREIAQGDDLLEYLAILAASAGPYLVGGELP